MNFPFLILSIVLLSGAVTQAQSEISFGQFSYRGSGCPKGSANLSLDPAQNALSIMFDQFIAEAGSTTSKSVDEKSCSISIPIQLPEDYSLSISQVEVQGFNLIPAYGGLGLKVAKQVQFSRTF